MGINQTSRLFFLQPIDVCNSNFICIESVFFYNFFVLIVGMIGGVYVQFVSSSSHLDNR